VFTFALRGGSTVARTNTDVCLLTFAGIGRNREVTGHWHAGHITGWSWSFVHLAPASTPTPPSSGNVRVLDDGRLRKIFYRR
jgi:hypothetical protein